jgi:GTPase
MKLETKSGYIGIVGRPNVGKSTLMNKILKQKLSITCRKPQTTRHQIMGIKTENNTQYIYVDTPGIHSNQEKAINRVMNRAAASIIYDVDIVVFIVEANKWTSIEDSILYKLKNLTIPVILVINKVDQLKNKSDLLPYISELSSKGDFLSIVPLSAKSGKYIENLEALISNSLPSGDFIYDEEQLTDRSERFLVSETIREKLMRAMGQELPYQIAVQIDMFKYDKDKDITDISATILVERPSQKSMVIGSQGKRLKQIGSSARKDIEVLLNTNVYLQLWVKVREGWSDNEQALKGLGYE